MTLKYFSQFYEISSVEGEDWFDPRMSLDTLLFIDPFLVFETDLPLFSNAQEKFFNFFNAAFELAHEATRSKPAYEKLKKNLKFPEAKELCLGFSKKDTSGSGSGGGYSQGFADALVSLASAGYSGLDHFEEIEIFTLGIGKDRISDATANIIKPELIKYTQQICKRFNVPTTYYVVQNAGFDFRFKRWNDLTFSLPGNPFFDVGERGVILVPKGFLRASHAIGSDGFEEYIKDNKNEELRVDLNYEIEKEFSKFSKSLIVDLAEKHPKWIREYVGYIENEAEIAPYDLEVDTNNLYRNERKAYDFIIANPLNLSASNEQEFIQCLELLVNQFKKFIEECDGHKLLWDVHGDPSSLQVKHKARNEFTAQSLFADVTLGYCQANGIKISREAEIGREIVEFSFPSKYKNRALVELKLARNSRLKQNELEELPAYVRAHHVDHRYYLVIPYTRKELDQLDKALESIKLISFHELRFKFLFVSAVLNSPAEEKLTDSASSSTPNPSTMPMQTILFLAANPKNTSRLRLDEECKKIEEGLVRAKHRDRFRIISKWAVTDDDLRRALLDYEPEIVHFSGHSGVDGIGLEDETGQAQEVSGEALAHLFQLCSDHIRCIVLNACYSETQATAISEHIDYVIGMKQAIGDNAAIKFAQGFYDALGAGKSFEVAYKFGCNAIDLRGIPENLTPILKKR